MKLLIIIFLITSSINTYIEFPVTTEKRRLPKNYHKAINHHNAYYNLLVTPNKDKTLFFITLYVTEELKPMKFMLDTGSSVLWQFEKTCEKGNFQVCGKFVKKFNYGYLDGDMNGYMIITNAFFDKQKKIANRNIYMMLVQNNEENVNEPLIGLANTTNEFPTFLDKLKLNGVIDKRIFSLDIKNQKIIFGEKKEEENSQNSEEVQKTKVKVPILSTNSYDILVNKVKFMGISIILNDIKALIDSGNTLIAIPDSFKTMIMDTLEEKNFNCRTEKEDNPSFSQIYCVLDNKEEFGSLVIKIDDNEFTLQTEHLIGDCEKTKDKKFDCEIAVEFMSGNFGMNVIIGQPFLKKFPATFNLDENHIMFEIEEPTLNVVKVGAI